MKFITTGLFIIVSVALMGQRIQAYQIYDIHGKKVTFEKLQKAAQKSDVVLFGEIHNNPIAHWLQYELTQSLSITNNLILGAEMFEADNQESLNRYLQGQIDAKGLDTLARLWKNFTTDYKPLLDFAKTNKLEFIATNVPRTFANSVYKNGFEALDTLPEQEKQWIAPLPISYDAELQCYKEILAAAQGHGGPNLPKAQAIKDATMAHFILKNYKPNHTFIHYNGTYHSEIFQGILWYLSNENAALNYLTIATVIQENPLKLENAHVGKANFIIVVDQNMTTTY